MVKGKAIEAIGILMVLDSAVFDKYLDMMLRSIEEERAEQRKS